MTALDAFSLSRKEWEEVEGRYEAALKESQAMKDVHDPAAALLVCLLKGLSSSDQKALALGVMIGRASQ